MKKLSVLITIFLLSVVLVLGSMIAYRQYQANQPPTFEISLLPTLELAPVWKSDLDYLEEKTSFEASVSAKSYIVLDTASNTALLKKNSQQPLAPASTTKLMTALVSRQLYDLDEEVIVATTAAIGRRGGLFAEERILVEDLIASTLISSANDAALALANHNNQSDFFHAEMNKMAGFLNLDNTFFINAAGYDDPQHLSTARDLAILTREAYADPVLAEFMSTKSYVVENTAGTTRHFLWSTNEFLGSNPDVKAGKTGTTENAGEVLATVIENGHQLVIVVMGSEDRYDDTQKLMRFVVEHF